MIEETRSIIQEVRKLLRTPESWINCFPLSVDKDGEWIWEIDELEKADKLSICGAIDLAAHRRGHKVDGSGYGKSATDQVVKFLYPLVWKRITTPFPSPKELYEDLEDGGSFLYEEFGYFNEDENTTHQVILEVLNVALAHLYCKTRPQLPPPHAATAHAFNALAEENKRKGITQ